ncbi:MAG TPA: ArgE/DapE family deacylase, partial [Thermoanaerobaculia bacterium]|nr:ArgE/DapE family deacylase [Thermoanaerobaculia bacterium]
ACVEVIVREIGRLGLETELLEVPHGLAGQGPVHTVRSFHGSGRRTLYFHGHYDVVPAQSREQFEPREKGGKLFGRGSADMKSGLVAMIHAVKALKDCKVELDGRIGLLMVPDEETGGARGSGPLTRAGILGEDGIGMLTPEPSSGVVWNANRGAITLRVTVKGKPAHVGLHFKGKNAFEGMIAVAGRLLDLKREVETRATGFRIAPEAARRSILLLGGECAGGSNFNVVPERMSFTIDRRINPEEDLETEKGRLLEVLAGLTREGIDLEWEIFQEGRPSGVPEDAPLSRALALSAEEVTGRRPEFEICPGLLENRFYAERGVPALAYGPGLLSVSHGPNEFVVLEDVLDCATTYALTAARLL